MYEIFEHTADLGLRVRAGDRESLFTDAAIGLFSISVVNLDVVCPVQKKTYQLPSDESDLLLADWLTELLFTFDTEHMLFSDFVVNIGERGLCAVCRGEPLDPERHVVDHEVKAITYHGLKVEQTEDGWLAEVIVDI